MPGPLDGIVVLDATQVPRPACGPSTMSQEMLP